MTTNTQTGFAQVYSFTIQHAQPSIQSSPEQLPKNQVVSIHGRYEFEIKRTTDREYKDNILEHEGSEGTYTWKKSVALAAVCSVCLEK